LLDLFLSKSKLLSFCTYNVSDYKCRNGSKIRDFETFDVAFTVFTCPYDFFVYYCILFDGFALMLGVLRNI